MMIRLRNMTLHRLTISRSITLTVCLRIITLMGLSTALVCERILRHRDSTLTLLQGPCETMVVTYPADMNIRQVGITMSHVNISKSTLRRILIHLRDRVDLLNREGRTTLVVRRRIFINSSRLVDRIGERLTLRLRLMNVLRVVELLIYLTIRVGSTILSLRNLAQRARTTLRMILTTINEATSSIAVFTQRANSMITSNDVRFFRMSTLLR